MAASTLIQSALPNQLFFNAFHAPNGTTSSRPLRRLRCVCNKVLKYWINAADFQDKLMYMALFGAVGMLAFTRRVVYRL